VQHNMPVANLVASNHFGKGGQRASRDRAQWQQQLIHPGDYGKSQMPWRVHRVVQ
jgi:hypothetical protein